MDTPVSDRSPIPDPQSPSTAKTVEGIAFTFCKAGTIMLLALPLRKFALPSVAGLTATLFIIAAVLGQKESRCVLRKPLIIAAFWGAVCAASLYLTLRPMP